MHWFNRLTLSRQFLVASFPILLVGMVIIGLWVEREIERGILSRISEVQSLYIDSIVASHLQEIFGRETLDPKEKAALDALFVDTALGRKIVAFIIWRPDGRILYSNQADLIGRVMPVGRGLRTALGGAVDAKVIDRRAKPHPHATPAWPDRLIETYAPIHAAAGDAVVGASEFYLATEELDDAMRCRAPAQLGCGRGDDGRDVPPAVRSRAARQPDDRRAARGAHRAGGRAVHARATPMRRWSRGRSRPRRARRR